MSKFMWQTILAFMTALSIFFGYRLFISMENDRLFFVSMENDNLKQYLSLERRTIETLRLMSLFFSRCEDSCDVASLEKFLSQSNAPVSSHHRDDVLFAAAITVRFDGKRVTSIEVSN